MRLFAIAICLSLLSGCSDDSSPGNPDGPSSGTEMGSGDTGSGDAGSDDVGGGDLSRDGFPSDAALDQASGPTFQDTCPPTSAPITSDTTLKSTTSAKNLGVLCSAGTPYAQVAALKLTKKTKVSLTVESSSSLTTLAVRPDCTTFKGCKAGDAKSGMTYEVERDAGTHYIFVGTNDPLAFKLDIKLLSP